MYIGAQLTEFSLSELNCVNSIHVEKNYQHLKSLSYTSFSHLPALLQKNNHNIDLNSID